VGVAAAVFLVTASGCGGAGHTAAKESGASTTTPSTSAPSTTSTSSSASTVTVAPGTTATTRGPATATTLASGGSQTVMASTADLDVTMTVSPLRGPAGTSVGFSVTANASHATGALGYQLSYGDGTTAQNPVPQFCTAGGGNVSNSAWTLTHRYAAAGSYATTVHVFVNCSGDAVTTAAVTVAIA
jgi:hypothetical protein